MRTHLLCPATPRNYTVIDQGLQISSTQNFYFGNLFPVDYGCNYNANLRTGFLYATGSFLGAAFAAMIAGRCQHTGGRGGTESSSSSSSTGSTSTTQPVDADLKVISECIKELKDLKANPTEQKAKDLYNKLKPLTSEPKDAVNKDDNIISYKHLLEDLEEFAQSKGWKLGDTTPADDVKPDNEVKDDYAEMLKGVTWNNPVLPSENDINAIKLPQGYSYATKDDDFSSLTLKRAHDTGKPADVEAKRTINGKVSYVSPEKDASGFPTYLVINANGGSYKYHFAGTVGGKAIYNTPQKDGNNNHYVLTKDSQGNLVLWQDKGLSGHDIRDMQLG